MVILHVCDSIVGGTGSYLAELIPLQAARHGARNIVLLIPEQHLGFLEDRITSAGVRIETFDRRDRPRGMIALARVFPRIRRACDPDIVHAHSFGAGVVTRLARRGRARLIFCPHGWAFDMEVGPVALRVISAVERILAVRADRIVLISHHEEKRARDVGIAPAKLSVVPNGIDATPPSVVPAVWSDDRLKILFVGRFDRQKGLDVLLEAIRPLGERVTVRLVGAPVVSGDETFAALPDHVRSLGWLPREEVAAQMAACDILAVPSRWEGFGLVAVEAMRLGKAVLASAAGGLSEILGPDRFGFSVPPGDPAALRDRVMTMTREEIVRRGAAGHRHFLENYTADRMAAGIEHVYDEALAA